MENSWDHEWARALKAMEAVCDIPEMALRNGETIKARYDDSYLNYHNTTHIFDGIKLLDEYEAEAHVLMPVIRYAWMNHDSSCNPLININEELAAFLACAIIGNDMPHEPILCTKWGRTGTSVAGHIIRDVDYSYFGLPTEEFLHITTLIRSEYKHLTDDEWKAGRKWFLESLDPEKIFWSAHFQKKFKDQVKINVEKGIEDLS